MPKLKTKKALSKRVKVTANKKLLHSKAGRRHLLSGKSKKRKRGLKKRVVVAACDKKALKTALPYDL
ncbi:MAG: 50S ribosomal protein L35 [Candidatus Omnitrophota bacterium]|nr:50S ribosomal protein L35 [Candidatus Omnitrophota bacterium]